MYTLFILIETINTTQSRDARRIAHRIVAETHFITQRKQEQWDRVAYSRFIHSRNSTVVMNEHTHTQHTQTHTWQSVHPQWAPYPTTTHITHTLPKLIHMKILIRFISGAWNTYVRKSTYVYVRASTKCGNRLLWFSRRDGFECCQVQDCGTCVTPTNKHTHTHTRTPIKSRRHQWKAIHHTQLQRQSKRPHNNTY